MSTREEWVRVKSESELRPGMTVELRRCRKCGRRERLIISADKLPAIDNETGEFGMGWPTISACTGNDSDFSLAIPEGRLYRLSDLTDDSEATDATKELVTT